MINKKISNMGTDMQNYCGQCPIYFLKCTVIKVGGFLERELFILSIHKGSTGQLEKRDVHLLRVYHLSIWNKSRL